MKAASPTSLIVLCCAVSLPTVLGACGTAAPPPVVDSASAGKTSSVAGAGAGGAPLPASSGGSAGAPTGSSGAASTAGAAGSATAGSSQGGSAAAGTGATPSSGAGGVGGAAGSVGSGGAGGSSSAGMPGTGADLVATVAGPLDGQMLLGPCLANSAASVCQTTKSGCPAANPSDPALSGVLTTDNLVTLGGEPSKTYTITLHVQGVVESKRYDTGKDQESQLTSPKMDGFCEGGTPSSGDAYNVYLVRVSSPKKDYFLNSLQKPGVSNHTTYGIDYTAKIQANGGAQLRLVAADSNCSMIKNCGPMENSGDVCAAPIKLLNIDAKATMKNPTFKFDQAYNGQWIVIVVTAVVAN